ncbi:MAG: phosphodiester glycosidase family protein [Solirubrobacterales bacterium]
MPASTLTRPTVESRRLALADGAATTLRVARFDRRQFGLRVVAIDPCATLRAWCRANAAEHAIVGGFYVRPGGPPLGDVWIDGRALPVESFDSPWDEERACLHADGPELAIRPRQLLGEPRGDLLQAGPKLVGGRRSLVRAGRDPEGFSAGARQFDSDITEGRYPRAALGLTPQELIAAVCEGRADEEAGLTMAELATAMRELGAVDAINLDGGGSASLVVSGALLNTPREEHGLELVGGREIATALQFFPR